MHLITVHHSLVHYLLTLIVWDEAPVMHNHIFEAVNRTLKDITKNNTPFGGKVVVFRGDFHQVIPIVQRGTQSQVEQD